ncbi:MAG TPA: hypothetical protein VK762_35170 [Polyangiaceae bacterium]|jgi:hypothetical protein|nr:hypothetical protein [Polyangiaceae bacterium]
MKTWLDLFPLFRLPAANSFLQPIAPVTSWFSPTIELNYKGDPAVERDVVTSVAGYGSQLGTLIDAVVEGAHGKGGPAMQRLRALKKEIDSLKARHGGDDASRARSALAALAASDPQALQEVVAEFAAKPG